MQSHFYEASIAHHGWTESFLTLLPPDPAWPREELALAWERLARRCSEPGCVVLSERVMVSRDRRDEAMAIREQAWASLPGQGENPLTVLHGGPPRECGLAGVHVTLATSLGPGVRVRSLGDHGSPRGAVVETPSERRLYLSGVSGLDPSQHPPGASGPIQCPAPRAQAERMFREAASVLVAEGMAFTDVIRTWIFMPRLLDWYDDFNRARSECFREFGWLQPGPADRLPASTGIQAARHEREECFLDLLAVAPRGSAPPVRIRNPRQNEAPAYGSRFSRGMRVEGQDRACVYVSGTASIDREGRSTHADDPEGQVLETLLNVAALLEGQGLGLRDIVQGAAYCKDAGVARALGEVARLLDLPTMPLVPVLADICRPDLCFEVEAIAVG